MTGEKVPDKDIHISLEVRTVTTVIRHKIACCYVSPYACQARTTPHLFELVRN